MRDSVSLKMIPSLCKGGSKINYYDPTGIKNSFHNLKKINFYNNIKEACKRSDLLIIHTEWNEFKQINFKKLVKRKHFKVFDMRNLYSFSKMKKNNIKYFGIGR